MTNRSRARWSLAVALAAHAAALAWTLGRARTPPAADARSSRESELEIAVDPPPTVAPPPPPAPPPPESTQGSAEPPRAVATRSTPPSPRAESSATAMQETPAPVVSAAPGQEGSWTYSPTKPAAPAGGAAAAEAVAALTKATAAGIGVVLAEAEKKAADRARKPLIFTARDMSTGLVPGGQYVAITRDRVRNSLVPNESHALLEFWTDRRGLVARVRVLDASSDRRDWDDVAGALAEDAHAAFPLKIPSNADGLIVTLDVKSVMTTISGAAGTRSALVKAISAIQDPADAIMDAKAVPQRVVSARVVSVEAF